MTLIYPDNRNKNQAQTHVLIIGVGKYTYLNGSPSAIHNTMGMGQLKSSPFSAIAFAKWIEKKYNNLISPLGSVELLISDHTILKYKKESGEEIPIDSANIINVENAFNSWKDRCHRNPNNVAIFYFCGHGIEEKNLALLLEDFGQDTDNLFRNAINFEANKLGMFTHCQAKTQLYFIDACRKRGDRKVSEIVGELGTTFKQGSFGKDCQNKLILMASESGQEAYGIKDTTSLFTKALIQCLDGLGCDFCAQDEFVEKLDEELKKEQADIEIRKTIQGDINKNYPKGAWVLDIAFLSKAVEKTVNRLIREDPVFQSHSLKLKPIRPDDIEQKGFKIIHISIDPIYIPIIISVEPHSARKEANLYLKKGHRALYSQQPSPQSWKEIICADLYDVEVIFKSVKYQDYYNIYNFQSRPYDQPKKKKITVKPI